MNTEYWRISLETAFDEVGCYDILKSVGEENLNQIIERLSDCADVEGEYTGEHLISDPRDTEVDQLKKKIKDLEETIRNNGWLYSKKISDILKINPEDLSIGIDRDEVKVEWRR